MRSYGKKIDVNLPTQLVEFRDTVRAHVDGVESGLKNETKQIIEDVDSVRSVLSQLSDDVRVNSSELELNKALLDTTRRRLTDAESDRSMDVVKETIADLSVTTQTLRSEQDAAVERIGILDASLESVSNRLGDWLSADISGVQTKA